MRDQRTILVLLEKMISKEISIESNTFRQDSFTKWEYDLFFRGILPDLYKSFDEMVSLKDSYPVASDTSISSDTSVPGINWPFTQIDRPFNAHQREAPLSSHENLMSMFCYMLMCVPTFVLRSNGMLDKTVNYMLNIDMGQHFTTKV